MNFSEPLKVYKDLIPRREWPLFFLILFFMLITGSFETLSIGAMFPFMSLVIDPTATTQGNHFLTTLLDFGRHFFGGYFVAFLALVVLFLFIVKNLSSYYLTVLQNSFSYRNMASSQVKLYRLYMKAPYTHHLNTNSAELIRNITVEVSSLFNNVLRTVLSMAVDIIMGGSVLILLLFVSPIATLITCISFAMIASFFNWMLKARLEKYGLIRQQSYATIIKWINEGLGGIKEIKVLGRESYFVNQMEKTINQYATVESHCASLTQAPKLLFEVIAVGAILSLVVAFSLLNPAGKNTVPMIAMFSLAGMRLAPAFNRIMANRGMLRYFKPSFDVVSSEFLRLSREQGRIVFLPSTASLHKKNGLIVENIHFRYPEMNRNTLKDISFFIPPNQTIGIIGESGAGKTTLINIILGLIEPDRGIVLVDGCRPNDSNSKKGHCVGYVPQEIYLSDDTIRNNVAYGLSENEIDDEKIWNALRCAQLDDFVASSPEGLNALVGERGVRISGGQKQRIGIARALYSEPKVLILDEPTSALDNETEKEISLAIDEISENKMIIIVTHRQGLLKHCNRIFRMTNGELDEIQTSSKLRTVALP